MNRALRLLGGAILAAGLMGLAPGSAPAQDTEDEPVRPTQTGTPPCSEPSPCPATDTTKNPEITCYEPQSSPLIKPLIEDVTLHIYGRHLVRSEDPPQQVSYRDSEMSGPMARTNDDIEVKSACHVVTTLHTGSRRLSVGDSVEFQLIREPPTPEEYKKGLKGAVSDWYYLTLTDIFKDGSPCAAQDPAATAIGDLSDRHHGKTVRLEGIVVWKNTETGNDKTEYGLRDDTGGIGNSIRVTTSKPLPEKGSWYSVTGEVAFNSSDEREYLKEQDRGACK